MSHEMTIDDAVNIANVASSCLAREADEGVRELATAAKRLVQYIVEQSRDLERERARRQALSARDVSFTEGHRLLEGTDGGGRRDFLAGRAVHAGQTLHLLTWAGWHPVRYESDMPHKAPVLNLSLPGVHEEVVIAVPRDARFAWPEDGRRASEQVEL